MHGGPTDRLMVLPPPSLCFQSRGGRNFEAEFVSLYKVRRNAATAVVAVCKRAGAVVIHADLAAAVVRATAHFLPAMHCNGYKVWLFVRETTFHMAETNNSSMRVGGSDDTNNDSHMSIERMTGKRH